MLRRENSRHPAAADTPGRPTAGSWGLGAGGVAGRGSAVECCGAREAAPTQRTGYSAASKQAPSNTT